MVVSADFARRVKSYFGELDQKLRMVEPHLHFDVTRQNAMEVYVSHARFARELPELVQGPIAVFSLHQINDSYGVRERFELGTLHSNMVFAQLRGTDRPRYTPEEIMDLTRILGRELAGERLEEFDGGMVKQPAPAIVHNFVQLQKFIPSMSTNIYTGSSINLRPGTYAAGQESPIEHHVRQFCDFIHTYRKPAR
jgi:hypothetical protein